MATVIIHTASVFIKNWVLGGEVLCSRRRALEGEVVCFRRKAYGANLY
jgi:hypothetical protein